MYNIRNGVPALGGAGVILGGGGDGDDEGDHAGIHGGIVGGHDGGGDGGLHESGGAAAGGANGSGGHALGAHGGSGGGVHGLPAGPHGALPFTGFDSLKIAAIALVLVVGGLLLMRTVMLISNDN